MAPMYHNFLPLFEVFNESFYAINLLFKKSKNVLHKCAPMQKFRIMQFAR